MIIGRYGHGAIDCTRCPPGDVPSAGGVGGLAATCSFGNAVAP
jgi:hypothetical protein